jgi:hypothetical protein
MPAHDVTRLAGRWSERTAVDVFRACQCRSSFIRGAVRGPIDILAPAWWTCARDCTRDSRVPTRGNRRIAKLKFQKVRGSG